MRAQKGERENVLVREGRCSDSFIHAPDCGGVRERSQEDKAKSMRAGEAVEEISVCLAQYLTMSMDWLKDGCGFYLHA